ncbi:MAG: bifunctional diaminohydroxyphosphoribosylaminopyrimidine deaminase/5-amino-6-(5-phosphoribosylamino)uracil reductase RibD, partial [Rhodospirillales bacterium]|nr:bifunctional diaminohydroxyphosphoribosylaminopyrimidine deaminase/5-amino-6-(5-phosphoribosylamino)uracil reductase RibD [Rhodospirillales bacterium]
PDMDGRVVGRGWTQPGGRPHAETEALSRAGDLARGATAYVTLEPCDHHGETPPCSQSLIAAGIGRVVFALEDPDTRVAGKGRVRLKEAGIDVFSGLCADDAEKVNQGFFLRVRAGRPLFTLKVATTLDGRIATANGESRWITGPEARVQVHRMRAEHDAILTGIGTVLADDPSLTCRLPGMEDRSPVRIVLDSRMSIAADCFLVKTAGETPTWLITIPGSDPSKRRSLEKAGVTVVEIAPDANGHPDLSSLAKELGSRGLTRVLVEGGGRLAASFVTSGLIDRLAWFRAPSVFGGDGLSAVEKIGLKALSEAPAFNRTSIRTLGPDVLETFERKH